MPAVSVVIPTYKHGHLIREALASVFAQTFRDFEVIVVNDGSPDDTASVLRRYVESGQIRYVEQTNAGQAAARNCGVAEAGGEFIALLDDDDVWPSDKLEWQVDVLRRDGAATAVGGSAEVIDAAGANILAASTQNRELVFEDLFAGSPFLSPGQTLIRATAMRDAGGLDAAVWGADDWDLYFRLARIGPVLARPAVALHYRLHSGNASRQAGRMFLNAVAVVRRHLPDVPASRRRAAARAAYRGLYYYLGRLEADEPRKSIRRRLVLVQAAIATGDIWLARQLLKTFLPREAEIALRTLTGKRAPSPVEAKA